jgi:DNA repair protein SbcC/Rad50
MRPVRLVVQGFTAFRDRVEVDFDGVDFFALVGPTGSGKSSVIDAICFALYGCVPRYEDRRLVAPALTTGVSEAKVSLEFNVASDHYVATRVVRRLPKGGATTPEARLERIGAGTVDVIAGSADDVSRHVERLLGLNFDNFTRCVVLPQGEFAKFLHDKPAERQQLLRSLLNIEIYARMGQRARQAADSGKNTAQLMQLQLDKLAYATVDAQAQAEQRVGSLDTLLGEVKEAQPGIADLDLELKGHLDAASAASRLVALLDAIGVPAPVRIAATKLRDLDRTGVAAGEEAEKTEKARKELEWEARRLPELGPLEAEAKAHAELRSIAADVQKIESQLTELRTRATAAQSNVDVAERAATAAREAQGRLRREHGAVDLAQHLVVGEQCPVCLAPVRELPHHGTPMALAEAERHVKEAEAALKKANLGAHAAATEVTKAETTHDLLRTRRREETSRVEAYPDEAQLSVAISSVREAQDRLAAARKAEDQARALHAAARRDADAAAGRLSAAWKAFGAQRDAVAQLKPPAPERRDVLDDWSALVAWAREQRASQAGAVDKSKAAADHCTKERDEILGQLAALCAGQDVQMAEGAALADMLENVAEAAREAKSRLAAITKDIAQAARVRADIERTLEEAAVADLLATHLKATGFERWLVAEALDLLVDTASATLRRLSGGQFSLARDERNEFLVVDHRNADERRLAKTLSGGETFQASLALALALADQLAGLAADGAARLESIFLDEGFGTLDVETLDTVADTIEALGSDERMVGIVTHVRSLADRVPVRYEVMKNARTSTVERRTA